MAKSPQPLEESWGLCRRNWIEKKKERLASWRFQERGQPDPFGPSCYWSPHWRGQIFRRGLIGRNFNKSDEVLRPIRPVKVRKENDFSDYGVRSTRKDIWSRDGWWILDWASLSLISILFLCLCDFLCLIITINSTSSLWRSHLPLTLLIRLARTESRHSDSWFIVPSSCCSFFSSLWLDSDGKAILSTIPFISSCIANHLQFILDRCGIFATSTGC